ncbi:MAG: prenyltransferase [Ilumatobacteraceae bacterium]
MTVPHVPGVITRDEIIRSGEHLASLQTPSGRVPWWPGGHCDPWNHVESAMALDVAGFHREADMAYTWLAEIQRPDGSWHNYYLPNGDRDDTVEDAKIDTNVVAYVATGVWHHWRTTGDHTVLDRLWPTVERALDHVLAHRRHDGLVLWAVEPDGTRTWDYALLTGSASIQHALRCGAAIGVELDVSRPDWIEAADTISNLVANSPHSFEPKSRWAMDWYYPVLTGAVTGEAAKRRLADGWSTFAMDDLGVRCVSDEPWITASETAEAALAFAAIGDFSTAADLLRWTRHHRLDDGAYLTGLVHPGPIVFPVDETSSYTAAAVLLAADAIGGTGPARDVFVRHDVR